MKVKDLYTRTGQKPPTPRVEEPAKPAKPSTPFRRFDTAAEMQNLQSPPATPATPATQDDENILPDMYWIAAHHPDLYQLFRLTEYDLLYIERLGHCRTGSLATAEDQHNYQVRLNELWQYVRWAFDLHRWTDKRSAKVWVQ